MVVAALLLRRAPKVAIDRWQAEPMARDQGVAVFVFGMLNTKPPSRVLPCIAHAPRQDTR
jgi:hypothetical protein